MTLGEALRALAQRVDRLDARLLIQQVSGCRHQDFIARPEMPLSPEQMATLEALVQRRESGEPLAYLTGVAGFYGRDFRVSPAVLIPRPETALLIETSLACLAPGPGQRVADLGTGSGIVAITLALERPDLEVVAVDISPDALAVARDNAQRLGARVDFRLGSWCDPLAGEQFDLIASNPPYIAEGDPHLALNGLPFEPRLALTDGQAGGMGLACLEAIIATAPAHLKPGGHLLLEHGYDQGPATCHALQAAGLRAAHTLSDLAGIDRVSTACL